MNRPVSGSVIVPESVNWTTAAAPSSHIATVPVPPPCRTLFVASSDAASSSASTRSPVSPHERAHWPTVRRVAGMSLGP